MSFAKESKPIGLRSQSQAFLATLIEFASGLKLASELKSNLQASLLSGFCTLAYLTSPVMISIIVTSQFPGGAVIRDLARFTTLISRSFTWVTPLAMSFAASNMSSVILIVHLLSISSESSPSIFEGFLGLFWGSYPFFIDYSSYGRVEVGL